MTPAEVLECAADGIEQWGHCKGVLFAANAACALGAIARVGGARLAITEEAIHALSVFVHGDIADWNDAPERTAAEVTSTMRAVAATLRAQERESVREIEGHTAGSWFEKTERHVAQDYLPNDVRVSTVFLGLDHSFVDKGPPILFETMIFGGPHDQYQERYATWEQAADGHAVALALAKSAP